MIARPLAAVALLLLAVAGTAFAAPKPTVRNLVWATNLSTTDKYTLGYPANAGGLTFIAGSSNSKKASMLWAVDEFTGALQWQVALSQDAGAGLYVTVGAGLVYVGTMQGLYAFKQADGLDAWYYDATALPALANAPAGRWPGKPTFHFDSDLSTQLVFCTWYNTPMVVLSATTGIEAWRTQEYVGGRIWATEKGLFFYQIKNATAAGTEPGYFLTRYAVAQRTPMWQVGPISTGFTSAAATAHALASKVQYTSTQAMLRMFNTTDGSSLTTSIVDAGFDYNVALDHIFQMTIAPDGTHLIVTCFHGENGGIKWRSNVPSTNGGSNVVASDRFVLLQGNTRTWVLDAIDGSVLYPLDVNQPRYGTVNDANGVYVMGFGEDAIGAFRLTARP